MTKQEMRIYYKIRKDTHLKANNLSDRTIRHLKQNRKKFILKQKKILNKFETKRKTKRNINTLTNRQHHKLEKHRVRAVEARKKLKYKNEREFDKPFERIINEKQRWYSNFISSNVWKFRTSGQNLMVMFLDGSIYIYFRVAKLFLGLYNTGSKGKYVWNQLRRKNINYAKIR